MIIRSGEITQRESVRFRYLTKKINPGDSAATGHVLYNDGRISRYMPGKMPSDDPSFDIGGSTGGKVDEESDGFSLVKGPFSR